MENPQILHQMHQGSAKVCEVDMVGEGLRGGRRRVGGGGNVGCSVECDTEW